MRTTTIDTAQRLSVPDRQARPMRDLRISVIDECNFRCTYCMPAELYGTSYRFLDHDQLLSFDEIERVAGIFASLGVNKIKITGGEPLLRSWLPDLIERLVAIPGIDDVGLITNGHRLAPLAARLYAAGLRRVTVSLDALDQDLLARITGGRGRLSRILAGIERAAELGFSPVKINVVVQRGVNESQIVPIAERFREHPFIVRFIEFMDVGTLNGWRREKVVTAEQIVETLSANRPLEPIGPGYDGEVAERYRYADGSGEIGVIASVTRPFCGDCTRIRLSADGALYTCLFARDGLDLRARLRSGEDDAALAETIAALWSAREDRYAEARAEHIATSSISPRLEKVEMFRMGG
jgi:cyclic pyranopterin phosphate synthase